MLSLLAFVAATSLPFGENTSGMTSTFVAPESYDACRVAPAPREGCDAHDITEEPPAPRAMGSGDVTTLSKVYLFRGDWNMTLTATHLPLLIHTGGQVTNTFEGIEKGSRQSGQSDFTLQGSRPGINHDIIVLGEHPAAFATGTFDDAGVPSVLLYAMLPSETGTLLLMIRSPLAQQAAARTMLTEWAQHIQMPHNPRPDFGRVVLEDTKVSYRLGFYAGRALFLLVLVVIAFRVFRFFYPKKAKAA